MYYTNSVFVIDKSGKPLKPCHPAVARKLQASGKAKQIRLYPSTIALQKDIDIEVITTLELRIDPGSKFTGFAIVDISDNSIIWGMELKHRGNRISQNLTKRAGYRRGRRSRNTRYRKKRFNRHKPVCWLAPSLMHRVLTVETWIKRIIKYVPISSIAIEKVKFDMHSLENPEIQGVEYQQGTLAGYTLREALLEHWGRECAYCGVTTEPLEIEHIQPKSKGGSNRFSNLTLACHNCNQEKGNCSAEEFLQDQPDVLSKIKANSKKSLSDAAAVNSTRNAIFTMVGKLNLPLVAGNGASTKMVRVQSNLPKEHWIDAGCVATELPVIVKAVQPLRVSSVGNGNRQYRRPNAHGFPDITVKKDKETGKKIVSAIQPKKEYKHATAGDVVKVNLKKARKNVADGIYTARVKTPTINGTRLGVEVKINNYRISVGMSDIQPVHRSDGYAYKFAPISSALLRKTVIK